MKGGIIVWRIKEFKTREEMLKFIGKNEHKMQWHEIFINNKYAIEYKRLIKIY